MIMIFKNIKPSLIFIMIGILIGYGYTKTNVNSDVTMMLSSSFGGQPLVTVLQKGLFVMMISLLQYIHVDFIVFYIDNSESLLVRYGSMIIWMKILLKGVLLLTGIFIICIYICWLFLELIFDPHNILSALNFHSLLVMGRIYLFCVLVILLQIIFLLIFSKSTTYLVMGIFSVFLAMTSHYNIIFSVLPKLVDNSTNVYLNVSINFIYGILFIFFIYRQAQKKELFSHED